VNRIALLLLLLAACATDLDPPPHDLFFCPEMPAEDAEDWMGAATGHDLFVARRGEAPSGRCGILVCERDMPEPAKGLFDPGECLSRAWYEPGLAWAVATHELGHALGLGHGGDGSMIQGDVTKNRVTADDGRRVRERWGLQEP
jgi:hypothetical protein